MREEETGVLTDFTARTRVCCDGLSVRHYPRGSEQCAVSLFATKPETIGGRARSCGPVVHEFAVCELSVGGPLPDSIELALRGILVLLEA